MASFASLDTPRSMWSRAPSTARRASAAAAAAASYDSVNSAPSEALLLLVRECCFLLNGCTAPCPGWSFYDSVDSAPSEALPFLVRTLPVALGSGLLFLELGQDQHLKSCDSVHSPSSEALLLPVRLSPARQVPTGSSNAVCDSTRMYLHPQVAQGNVLTAELLRLSSGLPAGLRDTSSRFAPVLPDFRYLKEPAAAERRIEASPGLVALDDEFREVRAGLVKARFSSGSGSFASSALRPCQAYWTVGSLRYSVARSSRQVS